MNNQDNNIWEPNPSPQLNASPNSSKAKTGTLDINFRRIISVWPFVLGSALLGLICGLIYLRYVDVVYNVSTSINIEQKEELSFGQAFIGTSRDPFNDKIAYFKSPSLALRLVDKLGLQFQAEAKGRFKDKDYYGIIKWNILNIADSNAIPDLNFVITPSKNGFEYLYEGKKNKSDWGMPFKLGNHIVVVSKLKDFAGNSPITCYTSNKLGMAFTVSRGIKIISSRESNIINVNYTDNSNARAIDILDGLVDLFNNVLVNDKTKSFSQAITFIESRLGPLGRELDSIENSLANYKSQNMIVGTSANGQLYLEKVNSLDKQKNEIDLLKQTIQTAEQFIENPVLPDENLALVGISDPTLQANLIQYQQARRERDSRKLRGETENNPNFKNAEKVVDQLKNNINVQLANFKKNLSLAESANARLAVTADNLLRNTPMQEKILLDKSRMLNIKETLFLTLLQKKEEAAIAKASVTISTKVLYPPISSNATQSPSRSKILSIAVVIGMIIPFLFAFVKEILNNKIISKKQLQGLTNIPVIAELEQTEGVPDESFIIEKNKRSMFGEQVRSLRTNLNFYRTSGGSCNYIMITSSVSGEGKTFLSLNLSRSYAMQGKRVALLEFDLRRPKMTKALNIEKNKPGLSSVLIGKNTPASIIHHLLTDTTEVLDFFPAGAIPPNPQELISGQHMTGLKEFLDNNYDVVIIDTPPFGIVADAQILGQWADVTLVMTRYQQTITEQIGDINEWKDQGFFRNMALIFNGVKTKGYYGNKYGKYYYKRKYGYGYYTPTPKDEA